MIKNINEAPLTSEDEYYPAQSIYTSPISVEQWKNILKDIEITPQTTLDMLKSIFELGGEATCAQLAQYGGNSAWYYNAQGINFGRRIKKKLHLPDFTDRGVTKLFIIPFVGRHVNGGKHYAWKLRPELKQALEEIMRESTSYNIRKQNIMEKNIILYGPPGTGKTYYTYLYAVAIIEERSFDDVEAENHESVRERFNQYRNQKFIEFTTFHQSYSYEDFIEGIRPVLQEGETLLGGNIQYRVEAGIFKQFCDKVTTENLIIQRNIPDKTIENPSQYKNRVFIIDEINRGNISGIFGELISLIEPSKRLGAKEALEVRLPYSRQVFGVPDNIYIIGTMNTADRSLTGLDIALRRRFSFKKMPPRADLLIGIKFPDSNYTLADLLTVINQRIELLLDKDHSIGHAPFLKLSKGNVSLLELSTLFREMILPLLEEYFFDDWGKIRMVLNDHRKKETIMQFIIPSDDDINILGTEDVSVETRWTINEKAFNKLDSYIQIIDVAAEPTHITV